MASIYLSSTYADLEHYREVVYRTLRQMDHDVKAMEDYVARDDRPLDACLNDVAECDLYVGIFAWRYGYIPEQDNPERLSITEREYRQAEASGKPRLVFLLDEQADWKVGFIDSHTGDGEGGKCIKALRDELAKGRVVSSFKSPDHLARLISIAVTNQLREVEPAAEQPTARWDKPPFPGLETFDEQQAPIFFGREPEIEQLLARLQTDRRFTAVVGASGSGKSSLVAAGLVPRLRNGEVVGSADWEYLRLTPGESAGDPFLAVAAEFKARMGEGRLDHLATSLREGQAGFSRTIDNVLQKRPPHAEAFLFVDQFEELFTEVQDEETCRRPFIELLSVAAKHPRVRTLVTLRGDFYHRCLTYAGLVELLLEGTFPLASPGRNALYEMITRPAERTGLCFDDGLATRILDETLGGGGASEPGALALMAYALKQLYGKRDEARKALTHVAYDAFGGVLGAIGSKADDVFGRLPERAKNAFHAVFRELVNVDEHGTATRRRAPEARVVATEDTQALVDGLSASDARLLLKDRDPAGTPVVEVAHEALFRSWPRLAQWIETRGDDLRALRQVEAAAEEWQRAAQDPYHLWPHERLEPVYAMLDRLVLRDSLQEPLRTFVRPEAERLLKELEDLELSHYRRAEIGERLDKIGDPRSGIVVDGDGLPDIVWCDVPGGDVTLEDDAGTLTVRPFAIAKYPITYRQYRAFLEADDGYRRRRWWKDLAKQPDEPGEQYRPVDNHPADNVSWFDAMAFCRWLSERLDREVRLPTEWEWQQAATGGNTNNMYPWGADWDARCANTIEIRLSRTTAVGMYPRGASAQCILDLAGNVGEWCLNKYEDPEDTNTTGEEPRALRGGSWDDFRDLAAAAYRREFDPNLRNYFIGFRVLCSSPIA